MMMRYSRTNNANEVTRNTRNRTQIQLEVELVQCNNDLMVKAPKKLYRIKIQKMVKVKVQKPWESKD